MKHTIFTNYFLLFHITLRKLSIHYRFNNAEGFVCYRHSSEYYHEVDIKQTVSIIQSRSQKNHQAITSIMNVKKFY